MEKELPFEEFFIDERDRLLRVLSVVTGSSSESEDIVQESFLKVWERWESVRLLNDPTGYLYRIAFNTFSSRSRRGRLALRRAVRLGPPEDVFAQADDRQVIAQALGTLTPRQRAALVLTEVLGYPSDEAGRLLGIKGSTVRALNFQGRSALKNAKELVND